MGNVYLLGQDSDIWSNATILPDLVSLNARAADDGFTKWVTDTLVYWYHQVLGHFLRVSRAPRSAK